MESIITPFLNLELIIRVQSHFITVIIPYKIKVSIKLIHLSEVILQSSEVLLTSSQCYQTTENDFVVFGFACFLRVWDCSLVFRADSLGQDAHAAFALWPWASYCYSVGPVFTSVQRVLWGVNISSALGERSFKSSKHDLLIIYKHISFQVMSQVSSMGICAKLHVFSNKTD